MDPSQLNKRALLLLLFLIAAPILLYWPGTSGSFLVDDFGNLSYLPESDTVDTLDEVRSFIFSGPAGPGGRPVSLVTFLADAQSWPADPYSFKRTNILIHTINGLLLFGVMLKLFQLMGRSDHKALWLSFAVTALWVLHPLHVSTVLYVIQRMTELAALFTLAGMWCYLHGRQVVRFKPGPGYLWMSAGVVVCGALALFSKENGVLLPLLLLVLEFTLLRDSPRPRYWRYWGIPMLVLPSAVIFLYLAYTATDPIGYNTRDFTLVERVLTEPRVLFDYLGKIALPLTTPTLSFDDHPLSTSLWSPFTTLPAITLLLAGLVWALINNRRHPVLAFAILWFLAGHVLESTVISLEIYFEHRNYLPMLGPLLAVVWYGERLYHRHRPWVLGTAGVLFLTWSGLTWSHSTLWGDYPRLVATWAEERPDSIRAQVLLANHYLSSGETKQTYQHIKALHEKFPDNLGVHIYYVGLACIGQVLTPQEFDELLTKAGTVYIDQFTQQSLTLLTGYVSSGQCQISKDGMHALLDALLSNQATPPLERRDNALKRMKADVYVDQQMYLEALMMMDEVFKRQPTVNLALEQVYMLVNGRQYNAALIQLNKAQAMNLLRSPLLPSRQAELDGLRTKILERMKQEQ